jgi:hypothetical protein
MTNSTTKNIKIDSDFVDSIDVTYNGNRIKRDMFTISFKSNSTTQLASDAPHSFYFDTAADAEDYLKWFLANHSNALPENYEIVNVNVDVSNSDNNS